MASAHSNLGPSSAERWFNCPGSVALSASLPPPPSSVHAAEGTVAHDVAYQLVSSKATIEKLRARVGETVMQDGFEIEITDEMIDGAIEYHDIIQKDLGILMMAGRPADIVTKAEVRVEARTLHKKLYGTADFIIYQKGHKLIVYDYKYGKGVIVDPKENKQAVIYAIGAMDTEAGPAFDEIEVVIVQPRASHVDGSVRRWTVDTDWLFQFKVAIGEAADRTDRPGAALVAGKWCRFCPAKAVCPEVYKDVQRQAQVDFAVVPPVVAKGSGLPDVSRLSIDKLTRALDWEDHVNSWFEAARMRVKEMLESGFEVPGYKLVEGKSNRRWVDEETVISRFAPLFGKDALYEKKLLSPAKLEKIVGKGQLDDLTMKPEVPKTVAPESDPRPAAKLTAAEDFAPTPRAPTKAPTNGAVASELEAELFGMTAVAKKEPMWP